MPFLTGGDKSRVGQLNDQAKLLQKTLFKGGQGTSQNDQVKLLQETFFKDGQGICVNN